MEAKTLVVTRTSLRFIFCCRRMRCRTPDEILERTRTCGFGAPRRGAALPSLATGCCGRGSATRVGRRAAGVQAAEGRVGAATRTMRRTISASTSSSRYLGVCSFMLMSLWECPRRWSTIRLRPGSSRNCSQRARHHDAEAPATVQGPLVEQLFCKQQLAGSIPVVGSKKTAQWRQKRCPSETLLPPVFGIRASLANALKKPTGVDRIARGR